MNDRLTWMILKILKMEKATSEVSGMTLKEFPLNDLQVKINTLHKKMLEMEEKKLVKKGYKDSRSYTYYITQKALELFESEEDKNE